MVLACDKNGVAYNRAKRDYNFLYYPTLFSDGGYRVNVGAGSVSSAATTYNNTLAACERRVVPKLDLDLSVVWRGGARLGICAEVANRGNTTYQGWMSFYVAELVSSLGWRDYRGNLYTYPFLDFALVKSFSVSGSGRTELCAEWDGVKAGYGSVRWDNLVVIAVVANAAWKQGYANPPSGNPFYAYYVDASVEARPLPLGASGTTIPATGGTLDLHLCGYPANAGRPYILLGSASGTLPGILLPGGKATLPLNYDPFMTLLLPLANTGSCRNFAGRLDATGYALATLSLPALPGALGVQMHFAWLHYDRFDTVSNPVGVRIR